ncbi:hypothetical protein QR680_004539 [Steinernema hermaphroditum]|uniref:Uncharacterized protein n=1 Tax=Steinernema hermaphroditum TaxID=289476 RepID=A0AA39HR86_9BILA|nr:hypothetical protein QR680_004539 [Steinernema hermaphroditum]
MDGVPFAFCEAVAATVADLKSALKFSRLSTGEVWNVAIENHASERKLLYLQIAHYIEAGMMANFKSTESEIEEILQFARRFINRIELQIHFGTDSARNAYALSKFDDYPFHSIDVSFMCGPNVGTLKAFIERNMKNGHFKEVSLPYIYDGLGVDYFLLDRGFRSGGRSVVAYYLCDRSFTSDSRLFVRD